MYVEGTGMSSNRGIDSTNVFSNTIYYVQDLRKSFRDPASPFYLAPGAVGPSHPGEGYVVPEEAYTLHSLGTRAMHSSSSSDATSIGDEASNIKGLTPEDEGRGKLIEQGYL